MDNSTIRQSKRKPEMKPVWLFLHPHVYLSVKGDRAVLYNTLNHDLLEYSAGSPVFTLLKRLNTEGNVYVIKITAKQMTIEVTEFIQILREKYFGDIMDTSYSNRKPVSFKPILSLQQNQIPMTMGEERDKLLILEEIPDFLQTVTLYINSECNRSCPMCADGYRQFLCCHKGKMKKSILTRNDINTLLQQTGNSTLFKLNILGGNIFQYPGLEELMNFLNLSAQSILKEYYLHYLNIEDRPGFFKSIGVENNKLSIIIHFPIEPEVLTAGMAILQQNEFIERFSVIFVAQNDEDVARAMQCVDSFSLTQYQLMPYYNGGNIEFFKENIFIDKESLRESRLEMNDILERTILNTHYFKNLGIQSDRAIHANFNLPKIGTLGQEHIMKLVYHEFHKGKSWTSVRKHVSPCKSCAYHALCPPISNYEYVMGNHALCHMMG